MGTLCLTKKKKLKEETEDLFYVEVLQTGKIFTTNALEGMSNNFKQNFLVATSEDVAYCTYLNGASRMGTRSRNMVNSWPPLLLYVILGSEEFVL